METELHAVTHVKYKGAGTILCVLGAGDSFQHSAAPRLTLCPSLILLLSTLHCSQGQKKKHMYIKNNLGANSD